MATVTDVPKDEARPASTASGPFLRGGDEEGSGSIRQILLALVLFGALGLSAELLLLEHTESVWQWVPLVVLGGCLVSGITVAIRPAYRSIRIFQASMVPSLASGLLGLYLHYQGNTEFELEMDAAARGFDLLWRSLHGATPVLAPGAMVQLGLLGLVFAYRHPVLRRGAGSRPR